MNKTKLPNGIENIALSFSGGGFRAATFCLGCSSYLHQLPYDGGTMLHKVRFISSASGGSITALALFSMLRAGQDFNTIYEHILKNISGDKLMKRVFEILETESYWQDRPNKKRNLINAFTIAYDEDLFEHATYGSLFKEPKEGLKVIDEIAVNTTEFNNGQNFRFGTRGTIGNTYLSLAKKGKAENDQTAEEFKNLTIIKKIRLGDILACSSCFPGGFEPVLYPRDFSWKTNTDALTWQQLGSVLNYKDHYSNEPVNPNLKEEMASFMDGGIDDNQGIYAFMRADERIGKGYNYDLYLPCDVSSNYLEHPYSYPVQKDNPFLNNTIPFWQKRFAGWKRIAIGMVVFLTIAAAILYCFSSWKWLSLVLFGLSAGLALAGLTLYLMAMHYIKKIKSVFVANEPQQTKPSTWVLIWSKYKANLLKLPLYQLLNMVEARLSSVFLLVDTVYLKKIRRMSYDMLYSQDKGTVNIDDSGDLPEINVTGTPPNVETKIKQLWENNIGATAIYLLATKNDWMLQRIIKAQPWNDRETRVVIADDEKLLFDVLQPSEKLRKYIDLATAMETTLWFDDYHIDEQAKESLLIAGQATICFNLLLMVHRIDSTASNWEPLKLKLLEDWQKFKNEPDYLLK